MTDPGIVCMPCDHPGLLVIAGSVRRYCAECETALWLCPSSFDRAVTAKLICVRCYNRLTPGAILQTPTAAQLQEILETLNP